MSERASANPLIVKSSGRGRHRQTYWLDGELLGLLCGGFVVLTEWFMCCGVSLRGRCHSSKHAYSSIYLLSTKVASCYEHTIGISHQSLYSKLI